MPSPAETWSKWAPTTIVSGVVPESADHVWLLPPWHRLLGQVFRRTSGIRKELHKRGLAGPIVALVQREPALHNIPPNQVVCNLRLQVQGKKRWR
jgi:hypothetical protein